MSAHPTIAAETHPVVYHFASEKLSSQLLKKHSLMVPNLCKDLRYMIGFAKHESETSLAAVFSRDGGEVLDQDTLNEIYHEAGTKDVLIYALDNFTKHQPFGQLIPRPTSERYFINVVWSPEWCVWTEKLFFQDPDQAMSCFHRFASGRWRIDELGFEDRIGILDGQPASHFLRIIGTNIKACGWPAVAFFDKWIFEGNVGIMPWKHVPHALESFLRLPPHERKSLCVKANSTFIDSTDLDSRY